MKVSQGETPRKRLKRPKTVRRRPLHVLLRVLAFIAAQAVLAAGFGVALLRYGPFENVRSFIIGSALTSYRHQYLANLFTAAQIQAVQEKDNTSDNAEEQDLSAVDPSSNSSSTVLSKISNGLSGYALETSWKNVHVAVTQYVGERGELVSTMAKRFSALAAINGGGFTSGSATTGTGDTPSDFVFSNGELVYQDPSLEDDEKPGKDSDYPNVIALTKAGLLLVGNYSIDDLRENNVSEAVVMHGYRPLVLNGKVQYTDDAGKGTQPRTAIGQKKDGTIVLVVLDGRQITFGGSAGAKLNQLASLMLSLGCYTAGNLDGGGSTAMYYSGQIINKPSQITGERTVATAFYVSK